jgi:hypothetical protein
MMSLLIDVYPKGPVGQTCANTNVESVLVVAGPRLFRPPNPSGKTRGMGPFWSVCVIFGRASLLRYVIFWCETTILIGVSALNHGDGQFGPAGFRPRPYS